MKRNLLSFGLCWPLLLAGCAAAASVPPAAPTQVAVVQPSPTTQPTAVVVPATPTAVVVPATPTAPPPTAVPTAVVEPTATTGAVNCPPPPAPGKKPPPGSKPPAGCPPPPGAAAASAGSSVTGSGSGTSSSGAAATTTGTAAPAAATSATTTTTTGAAAASTTTTASGGAAAKSYGTVNGDWRSITGNGIPAHTYADPRGEVQGQNFTFTLPANPVKGAGAISLPARNPNLIGTSIYGIPIFSSVNAEGTDIYTAGEKFDRCYGHPNITGWYHYHVFGSCVTNSTTALWAYALDGFPIYGPTDSGSSSEPADLDACRGHEHGSLGYHYHSKDPSRMDGNYVIACFMGSQLGSWVNGSTSGP